MSSSPEPWRPRFITGERTSPVSEDMSSPKAWKPRSVVGGAPSPVKDFKDVLSKITSTNYDAMLRKAYTISVLENPADSSRDFMKDKELMEPIVTSFIRSIQSYNETDAQIEIYTDMFIDLSNSWSGAHGKTLMVIHNTMIADLISKYVNTESPEEEFSLKTFSLCKFLTLLYIKNKVPGLYIMKVLEILFGRSEEHSVKLFAKVLNNTISNLKSDPFFQAKLSKKYRNFVEEVVNGSDRGPIWYIMESVLTKW